MALRSILLSAAALVLTGASALAQLPEGPGKAVTERMCSTCHELSRSIAPRQDRAGWEATIMKMVAVGAKGTPEEIALMADYLAEHFPAGALPPIHINKAAAIDLESGFSLLRSQARAIVKYREENGPLKSLEDLKKVPGIDMTKIEARKDRLVF